MNVKIESISALGHSWNNGAVTTKPTATVPGVRTYTCNTCSETKTESIAPTGIPDINFDGTLDNTDAEDILKHITDYDIEVDKEAADINGDGEVNIRDAALILLYINGKTDSLN